MEKELEPNLRKPIEVFWVGELGVLRGVARAHDGPGPVWIGFAGVEQLTAMAQVDLDQSSTHPHDVKCVVDDVDTGGK